MKISRKFALFFYKLSENILDKLFLKKLVIITHKNVYWHGETQILIFLPHWLKKCHQIQLSTKRQHVPQCFSTKAKTTNFEGSFKGNTGRIKVPMEKKKIKAKYPFSVNPDALLLTLLLFFLSPPKNLLMESIRLGFFFFLPSPKVLCPEVLAVAMLAVAEVGWDWPLCI